MSQKRKGCARGSVGGNVVWRQSVEEATLARKPHYNGFACGYGAHGSSKYNRAQTKRAWHKQMGQEGASRGSFPFSEGKTWCRVGRAPVFLTW